LKAALKTLTRQRVPEAMAAQVSEAKIAIADVKKNSLGAIFADVLPPSDKATSKEVCFQTPFEGQRHGNVKRGLPNSLLEIGGAGARHHSDQLVTRST
jgi:hypothetical protein